MVAVVLKDCAYEIPLGNGGKIAWGEPQIFGFGEALVATSGAVSKLDVYEYAVGTS